MWLPADIEEGSTEAEAEQTAMSAIAQALIGAQSSLTGTPCLTETHALCASAGNVTVRLMRDQAASHIPIAA